MSTQHHHLCLSSYTSAGPSQLLTDHKLASMVKPYANSMPNSPETLERVKKQTMAQIISTCAVVPICQTRQTANLICLPPQSNSNHLPPTSLHFQLMARPSCHVQRLPTATSYSSDLGKHGNENVKPIWLLCPKEEATQSKHHYSNNMQREDVASAAV